jgi:mRNA interferase RelE/StbE
VDGYRILVRRSAEKEIARLPDATRRAVVQRIRALGEEPRPPGSQKLSGRDGYRIRQGDYRVVYTVDDAVRTVTIVRVAHRSDVYR